MRHLALLLLTGCTHFARFNAPDAYVMSEADRTSSVQVDTGFKGDQLGPYAPRSFAHGWERPVLVAERGRIEVDPAGGEVEVWLRRPGLDDRGFQPVIERTGTLPHQIPLELRLGWEATDGIVEIPVDHLSNVYGGQRIEDGDLLLVRVEHAEAPDDDYLFRIRRYGLVSRFGAGVLIRVPVPGVPDQSEFGTSTLAVSMAFGYRPRTSKPGLYWLTEQFSFVTHLGIGSTEVQTLQNNVANPVDDQVNGAFNAALVGGGIEIFRFVSLQTQVNLSSFLRDGPETPWALAVGFDAVQFARYSRDAGSRLFRKNELD